MNRRNFLKSIVTACGVAVMCPDELLKVDPWIRLAVLRKKNEALGAKLKWRNYHITAHFKSEVEYKEFMIKYRPDLSL